MSKLIPLTHGFYAIVDDQDFDRLNKWKWYLGSHGYALHTVWTDGKSKHVHMHHEILRGVHGQVVDHINRNKIDGKYPLTSRSDRLVSKVEIMEKTSWLSHFSNMQALA